MNELGVHVNSDFETVIELKNSQAYKDDAMMAADLFASIT